MADKLVIVESPAKSRTIEQYLGTEYKVKSSKGHIRDLAITGPGGLGIDIEHDFRPEYFVLPEKKDVVKELNNALKKAREVYLATDPDREGEAISWHLRETLDIKDRPVKRIVFNEITKPAILEAFQNASDIDMNLVSSQETRRMLDRIIGFKLSKLLQSKIKSKSAGRVQSASLKLIVDREQEIEAFVIEEYYEITAKFVDFEAKLAKWKNKAPKLPIAEKADEILQALGKEFLVETVTVKPKFVPSKPPFITSTMQQEASTRLGFSASKTMQIAQKLYEGVQIENESIGLITYMRTDSTRLSSVFLHRVQEHILAKYGKEYLGHAKHPHAKGNVQDAHEAIRPTNCELTPEKIKHYLTADELKLYRLIYSRAIASVMHAAEFEQTTVDIANNEALFRASGSKPVFDGYLVLYGKYDNDEDKSKLPPLTEGEILKAESVFKTQLFTTPPARYTEARLIKEMEDQGIGRPSTYAQTIQTLKARKYVTLSEKKFVPTEQGKMTIEKLDQYFHELVSADFSRRMEDTLDEIAEGQKYQLDTLNRFYNYFMPLVDKAFLDMKKVKPKETGEACPKCGSPMVLRHGKYGDFEACSNYPKCKYVKPRPEDREKPEQKDTHIVCPSCGKGTLIERVARKGKNKGHRFYGCSNYPKCRYIAPYDSVDEDCPVCGKPLVKDDKGNVFCLDTEKCGYKVL